jgi:acetolactate synthase-1/2/3 large subunit
MQMTGAEILVKALQDEGVEIIFGYPGGVLLDFYDALFKAGMRHVLTRHEQAAAHAADGFARSSGKVGVCMATSGPGATNLVTGIATAQMDSVPLVALTGQVPTHMIGGDAFQEADIIGITRPITKHSYLARSAAELPRIIQEAFHIASTGRPGPVVIDLPKDVLQEKAKYDRPKKADIRGYKPKVQGHLRQIKKVLSEITKARRPVIYAGGGIVISGASADLLEFAERNMIPVTNTLLGLGGFPGDHPMFLGMLGMHGTYQANMTIHESDMIIAIGARFDDRVTGNVAKFAPNAKIVHIDIDPSAISKNIEVHIPVVGDVKGVLKEMNKLQKGEKPVWKEIRSKWLETVKAWGEERPLSYDDKSSMIKPQYVIEKLCELTPEDAIITTEVGQNQMWVAQFYRFMKPRTLLSSGGLGTMGYGFPAAMGAQFAFPDRVVVDVCPAQHPGEDRDPEQLFSGYGQAVAGTVLRGALLVHMPELQSGFCQSRRSFRRQGYPDYGKIKGCGRTEGGPGASRTCRRGLSGRSGGRGIPHGAGRGGVQRDDLRAEEEKREKTQGRQVKMKCEGINWSHAKNAKLAKFKLGNQSSVIGNR